MLWKSLSSLALISALIPAGAEVLSNNLSKTTAGFESAEARTWLAASFTGGSTPFTLESITLPIANPLDARVEVAIYNDGGMKPGGMIATLTATGAYSPTAAVVTFASGGLRLESDTTYWVVLRSNAKVDWAWTADNSGDGRGYQRLWAISNDAGVTWHSHSVYPLLMLVNASTWSASCSFTLSVPGGSIPAAGGYGSVSVSTNSGCAWTAVSNASWITLTSYVSGSGAGGVTFSAQPNNTQAPRTGTITIGNQTVVVTQLASACSYSVSPTTYTMEAAGGVVNTYVSTYSGCGWNAVSSVSWIAVSYSGYGSASGTVLLTVQPNSTGYIRYGTVQIGGQSVSITQLASSCVYSINPMSLTVPAYGGTAAVTIYSNAACSWTAGSGAPWITIASVSRNGYGSGVVTIIVQPNSTSSQRTGYLTVAGQAIPVLQTSTTCVYSLSSYGVTAPAAGGTGYLAVSAAAGCPWTASSNASWLMVYSGSGVGSGYVYYTVAPNTTAALRSGMITIGSMGHVVTQLP